MPKPQRIEYENAFYHVMNRGRARQSMRRGLRRGRAYATGSSLFN
jgi:hypothetical protein